MSYDLTSIAVGLAAGGSIAAVIAILFSKNRLNDVQTQLTLETEKLRAANEMLFKTQENVVEKAKQIAALSD